MRMSVRVGRHSQVYVGPIGLMFIGLGWFVVAPLIPVWLLIKWLVRRPH